MAQKPEKWLRAELGDDYSADNFIKILQQTGYVEDSEPLLSDIKETISTHNPQITENLNVLHTISKGTNHLAAAFVTDRKSIYGIIVCPGRNNFCLKRLGAMLESLISLTQSMKQKLSSLKDASEFENLIEKSLLTKGVSIFDYDNTADSRVSEDD